MKYPGPSWPQAESCGDTIPFFRHLPNPFWRINLDLGVPLVLKQWQHTSHSSQQAWTMAPSNGEVMSITTGSETISSLLRISGRRQSINKARMESLIPQCTDVICQQASKTFLEPWSHLMEKIKCQKLTHITTDTCKLLKWRTLNSYFNEIQWASRKHRETIESIIREA
jgi:hypothetical protein